MAFPQVEIKDYEERPNIFAIRLPSGRWHDFDRATLAGEWAWYYHLAKCDNHVTEALQVQIQNAVDGLNELDGVIPFTEALGKGDATEYDTELAYLVGEAQRLGFDYEARAGFEKWVTEKAQAEMSLDEAIGVRNMVEMDFDAYAGPNPSWGDDQALIDYRENMPALLGAFAALLMHCRAAVAATARPTAPAAMAEAGWIPLYPACKLPAVGEQVALLNNYGRSALLAPRWGHLEQCIDGYIWRIDGDSAAWDFANFTHYLPIPERPTTEATITRHLQA